MPDGAAVPGHGRRPPAGNGALRPGGGLRWLAVVATVTMFLVVVAGALVTATGSGEGCGRSWPLCGSPEWTLQAVIEFSHRVISGIAALAVVALAVLAPRRLGGRRDARWLAAVAVVFLFLQAGLGAGVVLWGQSDAVLALHFGISLVSFASVALLSLRVLRGAAAPAGRAGQEGPGSGGHGVPAVLRRGLWLVLGYTYLVVYTGAYVRHTQSSLACPAWPACGTAWEGAALVQMVHRLAAGALLVGLGILVVMARRHGRELPALVRGTWLAAGLAVLQAASGAYVVLSRLELAAAMLHSSIMALLFTVLCHLALEAAGPAWSLHGGVATAAGRPPSSQPGPAVAAGAGEPASLAGSPAPASAPAARSSRPAGAPSGPA
ncbi:heme A synthase [Thermaerobacter sp. PB12/4term]|uniref:COX15/CtaA family protein n=1 Tax=Thermaerobacter sp. PB12/4term TaxID=2293838 RepID=UPI000E3283F2|nr:COX15/CtaA family protein [Thermaerobacter sp. PB12/4term]QIA26431.1 heme A synthase [Thermaerobacter sp. PB12/4term]